MDPWDRTWRQLQAGDPAGYEFLLQRLGRGVWAYLRRMTGRDDLADELLGRTWLRLVQTGQRIKSPRSIRQYVFAIARRQWLDELGHQRRDLLDRATDELADQPHETAPTAALEALARQEDSRRLRQAIDDLPEALREVVVLRVYAELTFRQIAELLGLPLGTVLTRMRSATHRLAGELAE